MKSFWVSFVFCVVSGRLGYKECGIIIYIYIIFFGVVGAKEKVMNFKKTLLGGVLYYIILFFISFILDHRIIDLEQLEFLRLVGGRNSI